MISKIKKLFGNFISEGDNLSQKVSKGIVWVFLRKFLLQMLTLVKLAIIARILGPDDFGIVGIATISIIFLDSFSQTGIKFALIQKKDEISSFLNTAWSISILRSILLFTILIFSAPLIANMFDEPRATLVIQIIAISMIFDGFLNIGTIFFTKELNYNKDFLLNFSSDIVNIIVAVVITIIYQNIWGLVAAKIVGSFVKLIMSYILHPYRPRIEIDLIKAIELINFGKWVLLSSILGFFILQGDDIIVGIVVSVYALGLYQMAYKIGNLPTTHISSVVNKVTMATFSKLQSNTMELREAYFKFFQLISFLAIPAAVAMFTFAHEIILIVFGDQWLEMVPALQILTIVGLIRSLSGPAGPVFMAVGKPKINTIFHTFRLIVIIILIYPFTLNWGIVGASWVILLSITSHSFITFKLRSQLETRMLRFLFLMIVPTIYTLISIISAKLIFQYFVIDSIFMLFVLFLYIGLTYLSLAFFLDSKFKYNIYPFLSRKIVSLIK